MNEQELQQVRSELMEKAAASHGDVAEYWQSKVEDIDHQLERLAYRSKGEVLANLWHKHITPITGQRVERIDMSEWIGQWSADVLLEGHPTQRIITISLGSTFNEAKKLLTSKDPRIAKVWKPSK